MAYNKEKVFKDVIKAIKENKLKRFYQIELFVEPTLKTLREWEWDNGECAECYNIKRELELNIIAAKLKMTNKWEDSDNPTLQIAAFKLMATDDEQKALSTNWQNTEHSGEIKTNPTTFKVIIENERSSD